MAIIRRLVAHDENEDNQWLKVDSRKRYVQNTCDNWQFLFGPDSNLSTSAHVLKVGVEFNKTTFASTRMTAYLYNPADGSIGAAASCTFKVYLVNAPDWTEDLKSTTTGTVTANSYYFSEITNSSLIGVDLFGGDTLMVEVTATRLNETYRERVYINHLGIYDNITRVRQDVEWLDISKLDE